MKPASRKRVRRVRKPKTKFLFEVDDNTQSVFVMNGAIGYYSAPEVRGLISFLMKAVIYLEQKGPK